MLSSCQSNHFQFDNVDYYHIDISDDKMSDLASMQNKSEGDIELESLLTEDYPNNIDKTFLKNLDKLYPIKRKIDEAKLIEIEEIYCDGSNLGRSKCIPVYRDVLIFKQKGSVVGVSKICFDCDMQYTIDKYGAQKEFDNNDFQKLQQILK